MQALRQELIAPLVAAGTEIFSGTGSVVQRYNVLAWLFDHCVAESIPLTMFERTYVVEEVQAAANGTVPAHGHYLTVGALRERIASLPEGMPVFYERVPATWSPHKFISEQRVAEQADHDAVASGKFPHFRVVETDKGPMAQSLSEGFGAFTAFVAVDVDGRQAFFVTAHY